MNSKKLISLTCALALTLCACSGTADPTPTPEAENSTEAGIYIPGTYAGLSANGRNGEVKVEVIFSANAIDKVTVTEHEETAGLADPAIEGIPDAIVKHQSLGVDAVSGATITSNAILEAVADAVTQAGGDVETLKGVAVNKEQSTEVVEKDVNLVVVGGGAAGIAAAVSAACEGMDNILLLEKSASIGGNAIRSGGFIEYIHPTDDIAIETNDGYTNTIEEMLAAGPADELEAAVWDSLVADYEAYKASGSTKLFDCPALLAIEYYRLEGTPPVFNMGYPDLVDEFDRWFTDEIGGSYTQLHGIVGYTWPRWTSPVGYERGTGYFHQFEKYIADKGLDITILTSTPATELITDAAGAVTGVVAKAEDGTTYNINSKNGVMLCTGGFANNGEMMVQYDTQWNMTADVKSDNCPGTTGDGILMAQHLGAALDGMENIMMFPQGDLVDTNDVSGVGIFAGSSNLFINIHGQRFVDETASRFEISHAVFAQDEPVYYIVTDNLNSGLAEESQEAIDRAVDHGALYVGETVADLAAALGVEPSVLEATVAQYNTACETYTDELFGRTTFADGSAVVEGPFYATPCTPVAHITIGGIVTDDQGRVLKTDGAAIPGLYAAGETVAGSCGISAFAYGKEYAKLIVENAQ